MTSSAILTVNNLQHVNFAASGLEGKSYVTMTGLAGVAYAMKPVWKNDGTNTALVRIIVEDNVAI